LIFTEDSDGIKGKVIFQSEMYELLDEESKWIRLTKEERTYHCTAGQLVPEFKSNPIQND
jgi:hypothetical protein